VVTVVFYCPWRDSPLEKAAKAIVTAHFEQLGLVGYFKLLEVVQFGG
jgi:hypothetical protein